MLALSTLVPLLVGCAGVHRTAADGGATSATKAPHVVATIKLGSSANAVVTTPSRLWVLGGPSGVVSEVDPKTNTVVRQIRTPHPPGFGTAADGSLWIASLLDDAVMELDADSGRVLRTIESSSGKPFFRPGGVAKTGEDVWVLNHGDEHVPSSLTRLDARTGRVTGSTPLPGHHAAGPIVASGQLWISLTTEGTVVRVDPATGRVTGPPMVIDTGCLSGSLADGDLWYSGLEEDEEPSTCHNASRRVDSTSGELSPVVYGRGKSLVDFASADGSVWASDFGRSLYSVNVRTGALRRTLTLDGPDDLNRLVSGFGSLWMLGQTGRLTRIEVS